MNITELRVLGHTIRFANDRAPDETSDAWKYKVDHGIWSLAYGTKAEMEYALSADLARDIKSGRCSDCGARVVTGDGHHHPDPWAIQA